MINFQLINIKIFDNFFLFNCIFNNVNKSIHIPFHISNHKLFIDFDKNNSFLQFYQFNNLCIQDFLLQLMNKSCILKNVEIMETDIPF